MYLPFQNWRRTAKLGQESSLILTTDILDVKKTGSLGQHLNLEPHHVHLHFPTRHSRVREGQMRHTDASAKVHKADRITGCVRAQRFITK